MATVSARTRIAIQNIMVATDFSACADSALKYAVGLANRYRSALYTVNVLPHTPFVESTDVDPEKTRRSAECRMADMAGSELFKGITHSELIREGEVADVLSDLVRQNHIDLIVLGRTRSRVASSMARLCRHDPGAVKPAAVDKSGRAP